MSKDKENTRFKSFVDWVNADSPDIPAASQEVKGHGHEEHGREEGGHEKHGHGEHDREECGHEEHGHGEHGHVEHGRKEGGHEGHGHREHGREEGGHKEHGHVEHGREEGGHKEHSHVEHGREEGGHEEHGHGEHGHVEHGRKEGGHEEHSHVEHGHGEHSHAEHGHVEHGHEIHVEPKLNEKDWLGISRIIYTAIIFIAGAVFVGGLLMVIGNLPLFGSLNTPAVNEVYARYLEQGIRETGAVNAVTGMILDYRAFDTFGESAVLFTAVLTVMLLLNQQSGKGSSSAAEAESGGVGGYSMIIQTVTKAAFPFVLLYGCYIILNGHLSPGGGFSGGTILGAALILYRSVFGERAGDAILTKQGCMKVSSTALLCYACLKGYSFFTGANHLESIIPTGVIGSIFSGGLILPLNIAVGLIVACTMYLFYQLFEGWRCEDESSGRKLL